MDRTQTSFQSIADFQMWVSQAFPEMAGQMLSLGQSPCSVEVLSARGKGFAVNRCKASDAMAAMGSMPMEGIGIATIDGFHNGCFLKAGDLLVAKGAYQSVWHAAHTYYGVEFPLGTLPAELLDGSFICMSLEQTNALIEFLEAVVNSKDVTLQELLNEISPYLTGEAQFNKKEIWELGIEVMRIAHSQIPEEKIKLPDLAQKLLTNKDKLNNEVKGLTGLTTMAVLRNARLHQCRYLIQQGQSVEKARTSYGFSNRKDFNYRYENLFGEIPTETKVD